MRNFFVAVAALVMLSTAAIAQPSPETDLGQRVWVRPLTVNTWLVRSISKIEGFGDVESNAVLAVGPAESVLIDTPATNEQTDVVLAWADTVLHRPVRHLIVTHWHSDRMGGIDSAHARGIESYALGKTRELANQNGLTVPKNELRADEHLRLSGVDLETYYPGHGHTVDNIVVWLPQDQLLDGGCFIKSAESNTLGNLKEINPPEWAKGVRAVQQHFPDATTVIPGHGAADGPELLTHTAEVIAAQHPSFSLTISAPEKVSGGAQLRVDIKIQNISEHKINVFYANREDSAELAGFEIEIHNQEGRTPVDTQYGRALKNDRYGRARAGAVLVPGESVNDALLLDRLYLLPLGTYSVQLQRKDFYTKTIAKSNVIKVTVGR